MSTAVQMYDAAIELQQQGKVDEAIAALQDLLQKEPKYALAHAALSKFFSDLEQYDEAIGHGQQVCELEPTDPFSFTALSLIYQKAGRIEEAERALMQSHQA